MDQIYENTNEFDLLKEKHDKIIRRVNYFSLSVGTTKNQLEKLLTEIETFATSTENMSDELSEKVLDLYAEIQMEISILENPEETQEKHREF